MQIWVKISPQHAHTVMMRLKQSFICMWNVKSQRNSGIQPENGILAILGFLLLLSYQDQRIKWINGSTLNFSSSALARINGSSGSMDQGLIFWTVLKLGSTDQVDQRIKALFIRHRLTTDHRIIGSRPIFFNIGFPRIDGSMDHWIKSGITST